MRWVILFIFLVGLVFIIVVDTAGVSLVKFYLVVNLLGVSRL